MDSAESAATRARWPVLMIDDARGRDRARDGDALAQAAAFAGISLRRVPSLHRARVQLGRPDEALAACIAHASASTREALETARAVRHLRPELPVVMAVPDAATARKLQEEIEAVGIAGVRCVTPDGVLDRLVALLRR